MIDLNTIVSSVLYSHEVLSSVCTVQDDSTVYYISVFSYVTTIVVSSFHNHITNLVFGVPSPDILHTPLYSLTSVVDFC